MKEKHKFFVFGAVLFFLTIIFLFSIGVIGNAKISYKNGEEKNETVKDVPKYIPPVLDKELYDLKLKELANNPIPKVVEPKIDPKTGELLPVPVPKPSLWPVQTAYPNAGAILPFKRVVAYYGNLYSTQMGILGEYEEDVMLAKLKAQVKEWEQADPSTPILPALHYIAVTAQGSAGKDGKYRLRMPDSEIDKIIEMAKKTNGIVFLDIQVGLSDIQTELPHLEKYLKMNEVHLGIDPEFSMKNNAKPGKAIGTLDASEINFAMEYLAKIVKENNLTPKILVIHRFTQKMVTNYKNIKPLPEVQFVMDMDGWGPKAKKIGTYNQFIYKEPVQFTGFKLFYKSDIKNPGTVLMTPEDLLKLNPRPIYIQYQ